MSNLKSLKLPCGVAVTDHAISSEEYVNTRITDHVWRDDTCM